MFTSRFRTMTAAAALAAGATLSIMVAPTASAEVSPLDSTETINRTCRALTNGHLYCENRVGAYGYADRSYWSNFRGRLLTSPSYFNCWGYGAQHSGGNNVWYWAQLDSPPGAWGNIPAVDIYTDIDPFPGVRQC
jgi:hypothetical protein